MLNLKVAKSNTLEARLLALALALALALSFAFWGSFLFVFALVKR